MITVFRQGAISALQLEQCLAQAGLSDQYRVELQTKRATPDHVANVAPGQTIRHYSPNIPSFLVTTKCATAALSDDELHLLKTVIVIDFGQMATARLGLSRFKRFWKIGGSSTGRL